MTGMSQSSVTRSATGQWCLLDELLAAIDAVLVSVHPRSGMRLFAALFGGDPLVDNLAAVGTKMYRRLCFSMVQVGAGRDVHLGFLSGRQPLPSTL